MALPWYESHWTRFIHLPFPSLQPPSRKEKGKACFCLLEDTLQKLHIPLPLRAHCPEGSQPAKFSFKEGGKYSLCPSIRWVQQGTHTKEQIVVPVPKAQKYKICWVFSLKWHSLLISWNAWAPPLHRKYKAVDKSLLFSFLLIIVCFDTDYSFRDISDSFWNSHGCNFSCFAPFPCPASLSCRRLVWEYTLRRSRWGLLPVLSLTKEQGKLWKTSGGRERN